MRFPKWLACVAAMGPLACGSDGGNQVAPVVFQPGVGADAGAMDAGDGNAGASTDATVQADGTGVPAPDGAVDSASTSADDGAAAGTADAAAAGPSDAAATGIADGPASDLPDGLNPALPCNGDPSICDKTYDAVTYSAAHAAMAYAFPPFACPAQDKTVRQQLDTEGIRALDFEAHPAHVVLDGGSPLAFCVASCDQGELPVSVALGDVSAFLAVNPREIVTLAVRGGVDAATLADAITAAGLDGYAIAQSLGEPWPTLNQMIDAGTRVVVFADVTGSPPAWMLPLWSFVAATGTDFTTPQSMTCDVAQGAGAPLYWLSEFLVDGEGGATTSADSSTFLGVGCDDPALAQVVNAEPFFKNRVTACTQELGTKPTFVAVDFSGDGDVSGVLRELNDGF